MPKRINIQTVGVEYDESDPDGDQALRHRAAGGIEEVDRFGRGAFDIALRH